MARSNNAKSRKANKNTASKNIHIGVKQNHFSMQQEARNTEGRSIWRTDTQLRYRAVQFVSAGSMEPVQELDPSLAVLEHVQSEPVGSPKEAAAEPLPEIGTESITDGEAQAMTAQQRSHELEDSSEDEIVFRGRRNRIKLPTIQHIQDAATETLFQRDLSHKPAPYAHERGAVREASNSSTSSSTNESPDFIAINDCALNKTPQMSDEDEILADYIANMDDSSDDDESSSSEYEGLDQHEEAKATAANSGPDDLPHGSGSEDFHSDGHEMSGDSEVEGLADFVSITRSKSSRKKGPFASASAFADALELDPYYNFDIMDFNRPSLRKKGMNGSDYFNFDALDDELGEDLLNAWNNDRLKKKSKKKEREQLRAQGLLGRRKNDPELKTKYADGIGFEDLKSEIRLFMLSSKNSLSLPPMAKHRRMLVHDMAHALRLSSQSRGKGSSRFPVLSKTSRTPKYSPKTISQIDRVLSREKFSPRALKAWDKSGGRPTKTKVGRGNVSYMDGEVVGASAPEIGAENIGRAMLEKMGWSRGTALGAIHNKGILLPVSQVVKNSKAGLG
ncbi:hypothetical protein BJX63DRAFT_436056 [Aspergillus granulosus]|uniref:Protein SQS1 n=1 Tax=Aspergillus granulosus TaxID=176169 RepID=A0ABR4GZB4_9EURO